MITPAPAKAAIFNAEYGRLGEYVTDDSRIPFYNDPADDTLIQPGEPLLILFGLATAAEVFMAQGPIAPGEWGMLIRYFTADFPAAISADSAIGTEVLWDIDTNKASLAADVTNGFALGSLVWNIDANIQNEAPPIDANGRVIASTSADTTCRVMSDRLASVVKGIVTPFPL